MQSQLPLMALLFVQERQEREIAHAAAARRARHETPSPSIRRAVGRRIIAIGARVAAEPTLEPVRSR
jgi:hypothetical protein